LDIISYSQSPLQTGPPSATLNKSVLKLVRNVNIVYGLCPETSTKLYVHELGFCTFQHVPLITLRAERKYSTIIIEFLCLVRLNRLRIIFR
jgi:hypothetical protein